MKMKCLMIAIVFAMLNVGCSDKNEEDSFTVKAHKKILCQKGCDDVLKNSVEYKNCVLRNCPDAKFIR